MSKGNAHVVCKTIARKSNDMYTLCVMDVDHTYLAVVNFSALGMVINTSGYASFSYPE